MSNFDFLHIDWPEFIDDAKAVEKLVRFDPKSACGRARNLVEQVVLWMYENDEDLEIPFDTSLYNITNEIGFKKIIGYTIYEKINLIRRTGNNALHEGKRVPESKAMAICEEVFHVMYWLYKTYRREDQEIKDYSFNPTLVPDIKNQSSVDPEQLNKLEEQLEERANELRRLQQSVEEKNEAHEQRNREIKQMRLQTRKYADDHDYNEAQTRELLFDVMLRESGWDPAAPNVREFKVSGMPNSSGTGGHCW